MCGRQGTILNAEVVKEGNLSWRPGDPAIKSRTKSSIHDKINVNVELSHHVTVSSLGSTIGAHTCGQHGLQRGCEAAEVDQIPT